MIVERRSHTPEAANMLRTGAKSIDDHEKGEVVDLMHSAEFRSLTSHDMKVNFFERVRSVSNGRQSLVQVILRGRATEKKRQIGR
jgi:hypothetical protein